MTIVENARPVTGGVDTHLDEHVAAVMGQARKPLRTPSLCRFRRRVRNRSPRRSPLRSRFADVRDLPPRRCAPGCHRSLLGGPHCPKVDRGLAVIS
jgi:hypothetical protein